MADDGISTTFITSNTIAKFTQTFYASASSEATGHEAYKVFSGDISTTVLGTNSWISASWVLYGNGDAGIGAYQADNGVSGIKWYVPNNGDGFAYIPPEFSTPYAAIYGEYVQLATPTPMVPGMYTVRRGMAASGTSGAPYSWFLVGSNDAFIWSVIDARTGVVWGASYMKSFNVIDQGWKEYTFFRLIIPSIYYSSDGEVQVDELYLFAADLRSCDVNTVNAISCTGCPLGSYSNRVDMFTVGCLLCPNGTYADAPYMSTVNPCKQCSAGSYGTGGSSNASCTACAAGTYSSMVGGSRCYQAAAGTYCTTRGATSSAGCLRCEVGKYSTGGGASSPATCIKCPSGTFATGDGYASVMNCSLCIPGSYSSMDGNTSCLRCEGGKYSTGRGGSSPATCIKCPSGTFATGEGYASVMNCSVCLPGSYTSMDGKTSCTICQPGTYSNKNASGCTPCSAGSFSNTTGASSSEACEKCGAGLYSSGVGLTDNQCSQCSPGTYSTTMGLGSKAACVPAPIGAYCTGAGLSSAAQCPLCGSGKYSNGSGASSEASCIYSPGDTYCVGEGLSIGQCLHCRRGAILWGNPPVGCIIKAGFYSYSSGDVMAGPPYMTSDASNVSGAMYYASASSAAQNHSAYKAFSDPAGSGWISADRERFGGGGMYTTPLDGGMGFSLNNAEWGVGYIISNPEVTPSTQRWVVVLGEWLQITLPLPIELGMYQITAGGLTGAGAPFHFIVLGSNDGWTWRFLDQQMSVGWSAGETKTFTPYQWNLMRMAYTQFRIVVNNIYGSSVSEVEIKKWALFPTIIQQCIPGARSSITNWWYTIESCSPCTPGTYSTEASGGCSVCDAGSYAEGYWASVCTLCSPGSHSSGTNAYPGWRYGACPLCDPGTYSDVMPTDSCSACPPGRYMANAGATVCALCPAGTYTGGTGGSSLASCTACAYGTYTTAVGASSDAGCRNCSRGQYQAALNTSACLACPTGSYTTSIGRTACATCMQQSRVGTFAVSKCSASNDLVWKACTRCNQTLAECSNTSDAVCGEPCEDPPTEQPGYDEWMSEDYKCKQGQYLRSLGPGGTKDCRQCPPGLVGLNRVYCERCGALEEAYFLDQSLCVCAAPARMNRTGGCVCPDGLFEFGGQCVECGNNTYGAGGACFQCGAGNYSSGDGATACQACPTGKYRRSEDPVCTGCGQGRGWYSTDATREACVPCNLSCAGVEGIQEQGPCPGDANEGYKVCAECGKVLPSGARWSSPHGNCLYTCNAGFYLQPGNGSCMECSARACEAGYQWRECTADADRRCDEACTNASKPYFNSKWVSSGSSRGCPWECESGYSAVVSDYVMFQIHECVTRM